MSFNLIVSVLNQKGGSGKTTISINLAGALREDGFDVLLIDADPQASSIAWSEVRQLEPLFPVAGMAKKSLHKDLPKLASGYDVTIIDGCPRVNDIARAAILASDLVLIPVQPSPFDVWAADEIVRLIEEAQQYREGIRAAFVINRKIANTAIGRDVRQAFAEQPFPVLEETIGQRVVFPESGAQGLTVLEVQPGGMAANEIRDVADHILQTYQPRRES